MSIVTLLGLQAAKQVINRKKEMSFINEKILRKGRKVLLEKEPEKLFISGLSQLLCHTVIATYSDGIIVSKYTHKICIVKILPIYSVVNKKPGIHYRSPAILLFILHSHRTIEHLMLYILQLFYHYFNIVWSHFFTAKKWVKLVACGG